MGRIMAIDFGQKRVGIAVTDENKIIATALDTVPSKDIFSYLQNYMEHEIIDCIVVGEPKQMNNQPSDAVRFIDPFVRKLKKVFADVRIERFDERLTSKIAMQTIIMVEMKKKERQKKENIDKISAVLILQSYMDYLSRTINIKKQ
jgi:putative Holliday junction resolvase